MIRTRYCVSVNACTSEYVTRIFHDPRKICLDCKYYKPKLSFQNELCTHPASISIDIVNGSTYFEKAHDMRMDDKNKCGLDARFFEQESKIGIMLRNIYIDPLLRDCMKTFIVAFVTTCVVLTYLNITLL